MPFTWDKLTRLLLIVSSSCTIAWYVHWFSNGVTGSSLLSTIRRRGLDSCLNSKELDSLLSTSLIFSANLFAISELFWYLIYGHFFSDNKTEVIPWTVLCKCTGSQVNPWIATQMTDMKNSLCWMILMNIVTSFVIGRYLRSKHLFRVKINAD